ncbi:hypothetical protein NCAS_0G01440 [Naumovozyma castellii]|uniref:Mannosyltransferase n=1 Tax=Naumovozyma castellii TaxID=27288 RepID=G0VHZ7_NAUCA|nr:hypothetical protein NCAS_0G01440 [Naumovozyma castellii CBS 4309]CCC71031.1 hypothetical protein NCAS_0G01440 [Naumovozyma castellii CBS 4309]
MKPSSCRPKVFTFGLLTLLLTSRLYFQPFNSLISDCDETFNYWEPLNLLLRGFGKQTWEYSPEYSIRSWAFLSPFYLVLYPFNKLFIKYQWPSEWNFYLTRIILGLVSCLLEWKLFVEIKHTLSVQVANIWLFIQIFNPGWFHASMELLPSSIAMLLYLASMKFALRYLSTGSTPNFISSLTFNFVSAILGWPFVLVLSLPLCFHYLFTHRIISTIRTVFDTSLVLFIITTIVIVVDSVFYGKFTPVSWNILFYNVINATNESGPNIFGVESWDYYILNLTINFPLPVLFASLIGIFHLSLWPLWTSLLTWMIIFINQPHKEERFLYPIYPLISLCGSVGLYHCFHFGKKSSHHSLRHIRRFFKWVTMLLIALQATSRIVALIENYTAPIKLYEEFNKMDVTTDEKINVCTGREWYHFPNSFFLPESHRLQFVKSGFDGLLPGDFMESESFTKNIRTIPQGMNNLNKWDESKVSPLNQCHFFIDVVLPIDITNDSFDPYSEDWTKLSCYNFVDVDNSKLLGRVFYIPKCFNDLIKRIVPKSLSSLWESLYGVNYLDYCLFERIHYAPDEQS